MAQNPTLDFGAWIRDRYAARCGPRLRRCENRPPRAAEIDRSDAFPPQDLWPHMGALGLLGITVEEEYGGAGLGYLAHCVVMEEISRASASVGLSYGAHSNLCVNQIRRHGTEAQKRRYLPKLISGEHVGGPRHVRGQLWFGRIVDAPARRQKGRSLHSQRRQIVDHQWSLRLDAGGLRQDRSASGGRGITAFLIEKEFKGFHAAQKLDKLGMRGSPTSELVFEDCEVPQENALGELNQGVGVLMSGLDYERAVLAGGPIGIMQACLDICLPYVRERKQFGRAIGEFELVQGKLADMYARLSACRAYVYAVARRVRRGPPRAQGRRPEPCCLRRRAATQSALDAIQLLGGNGYINDYPTGRLLRDAKLYEIGAGTSEIRRMLIGRELFDGN